MAAGHNRQAAAAGHNRQAAAAAAKAGLALTPRSLARVTAAPNVGGHEHDVHEDKANNRFYKFTKGGHFGQNRDLPEYLQRHAVANRLWPSLGYQFHGVVESPFTGHPQAVTSMNRIEGPHPEQEEIHDWFRGHGWVPNEDEGDSPELGTWAWKDPESGTQISDAHAGNFIKTKDGLVPIDVDIRPGHKMPAFARR